MKFIIVEMFSSIKSGLTHIPSVSAFCDVNLGSILLIPSTSRGIGTGMDEEILY